MSPHESMRDDLAAYALGALPPSEAEAVERHLADCESCRDHLRWLRSATDLLPASVEQLRPPPSMRENVMATVRAEAAADAESRGRVVKRDRPARRTGWRALILRPATALAAVALIAIGVAAGYALRGDDGGDTAGTFVEAAPVGGAEDVAATLERNGESAILHVERLPEIRPDEVYEVWIQRGGELEPSTLFVLDRGGRAEAVVPGPLDGVDSVLVTREPSGGSEQPTSPPLLEARL